MESLPQMGAPRSGPIPQIQAIRPPARGVYAFDAAAAPWRPIGRPGMQQKAVRGDRERGTFLGLIGFDPLTRTGLHQHQAPALSYFLDGALYDYDGPAVQGQVGINLEGATHDAIAYARCMLAARLEGPVTYRPDDGAEARVHTGAQEAAIVNRAPEVPPDINITVEALPSLATSIAGLSRRMIFDYRGTGHARRMVQLALLPGTRIPVHATTDTVDWFLLAGDARVNGTALQGGCFLVIEPGTQVEITSEYGARLLAWAEGPVAWLDQPGRPDLYGF